MWYTCKNTNKLIKKSKEFYQDWKLELQFIIHYDCFIIDEKSIKIWKVLLMSWYYTFKVGINKN